ncbi:uncharacterized protein LOC133187067 [Saccostrea echinata]|uniref:uncharacterized protein LOC133187067 n=1 Tax=Saccostrea echinata TaxID=191078 RepID=UPI002A7FBA8A|nr:uncharacterized protein LOC133187067 [Saccostrea echinata]
MPDARIPLYAIPVGLFSWIVALLTPGWIINKREGVYGSTESYYSIFYAITCTPETSCLSTFSFDWALIDIHLASILSLILCGVGCRILWVSIKIWPLDPKKAVIGGVLVLIAATFEHVLLIRFYTCYFEGGGTECSNGVPYSVIIAGLGFLLVLFSVVVILIRYIAPQTQVENDQLISEETRTVKTRALPVALLAGILFKIVAFVTPGWIRSVEGTRRTTWIGIFYSRTFEGNTSWTSFFDNNQHGWIDLQINCVLDVLLSGAGCLVFILNSKRVSKHVMVKPLACISGGVFLCVAVTMDFALLIRFLGLFIISLGRSTWFPYSFVIACVSFALNLFSVVVILIRYNKGSEEENNVDQMIENLGLYPDVTTDNVDVITDNRLEVTTDNVDMTT